MGTGSDNSDQEIVLLVSLVEAVLYISEDVWASPSSDDRNV